MKKVYLILFILSTFLLSGCSSEIEGWRIRAADKICKNKGGIDAYNTFIIEIVTCQDGTTYQINKLRGE